MTTSVGRLTLKILLPLAHFERDVTAERIRDKVKASRMKGIRMGGSTPLEYDMKDRKLIEHPSGAATSRWVLSRFLEIGSATELAWETSVSSGITTTSGYRMNKKFICRMLTNRTYIAKAVQKGTSYPAEHAAIIDRALWDKAQATLTGSPPGARWRAPRPAPRAAEWPALEPRRRGLFPSAHTKRRETTVLLCKPINVVSEPALKFGEGACPISCVPAGEIEAAVIDQMRAVFR